jgi:hypothetical protein
MADEILSDIEELSRDESPSLPSIDERLAQVVEILGARENFKVDRTVDSCTVVLEHEGCFVHKRSSERRAMSVAIMSRDSGAWLIPNEFNRFVVEDLVWALRYINGNANIDFNKIIICHVRNQCKITS